MKTIWVVGVYDLFTPSDINTFKAIKQKYPDSKVVAGIFNDIDLERNGLPVLIKGPFRKMNIEHFRIIDQVVYPLPFRLTQDYLKEHKVDLVINYQWTDSLPFYYDVFGQLVDTPHFEQFSKQEGTDNFEILSRVLGNLDEFIDRNLNRGVTRQELNISLFTEMRVRFKFRLRRLCGCQRRQKTE